MRWIRFTVVFCLAACLGAAGLQTFAAPRPEDQPTVTKAEPGKAPAARWRYHSVRLINESRLDATANEQAEKGWELVEIVPVVHTVGSSFGMQYTMLFRRAADAKD